MRPFAKALAMSAAVVAIAAVPLASAQARDWHHHWHHDHGDALALGAIGLAAGALIGGAIASDPGPRYYVEPPVEYYPAPPPRVVYTRPAPVYVAGSLQPWTPSWYRYCENTYRSFNPRSGTYTGYDGQQHFCAAN